MEELQGYRDERPCRILAIIGWLVATVHLIIMLTIGVDKKTVNKLFITTAVWAAFFSIVIVFFYAMVYLALRKRNLNDIGQTTLRRTSLESKVAKTTGLVTVALVFSFVPGIIIAIFCSFSQPYVEVHFSGYRD